MSEYGMIIIVVIFAFIAISLWVFRKIASGIYQIEVAKVTTLFNCLLRACANLTSFTMQVVLVSSVVIPRDTIEATSVDMFFFALMLTTITYMTELLVRPDVG